MVFYKMRIIRAALKVVTVESQPVCRALFLRFPPGGTGVKGLRLRFAYRHQGKGSGT